MKGFRDIEQLSAYLDGQLNPSDSAQLESRLKTDPELASAYQDIRQARSVLRKLPARKSPRNFTLTRKMVGLKPPLPRAYPTFRFATTFATILFALSVAVNSINFSVVQAPLGMGGGCTGGCGGGPDTVFMSEAATEAVATEAVATEAPAGDAPAAAEMLPAPTLTTESSVTEDTANTEPITEVPTAKEAESESPAPVEGQREAQVIPALWQAILLFVIAVGGVGLFLMNQFAKRKWQ